MYEELGVAEVVAVAEKTATRAALEDRKLYVPFLARAEKYAADNRMIIGGAGGLRMLESSDPGPPPLDGYTLDLYSVKALADARALAQAVYEVAPGGLGRYTCLVTKVAGEEFIITVHGRDLIKVTSLGRGDVAKTATASSRPTTFIPKELGVSAHCLSPEVQLMAVYADLCNPEKAADWADLQKTEARLRRVFLDEFRTEGSAAGGGADPNLKEWLERRQKLTAALTSAAWVRTRDRTYITAENFEDEQKRMLAVAAAPPHVRIHMNVDDPKIPGAAHLRRLTVFAYGNPDGRREPVLYLYNAGQYELVPYAKGRAPAPGTPYVRMRFALVEMWTALLLRNINAVTPQAASGLRREALAAFKGAAADLAGASARASQLFPEDFIGRLVNVSVMAKRASYAASKAKRQFHPPFYPANAAISSKNSASAAPG